MIEQFLRHTGATTPVVCGPMYPGSNPELIAAVSEAGGLGVVQPITLTYVYKHTFRAGLQRIKALTRKPFGVNFTLIGGNRRYERKLAEWLDIAIDEGVRFFLTSLGDPTWIVERAHARGIIVYHDVSTPEFARKALEAGVDGLNCVNDRAGGQTGVTSARALAEALRDVKVPLVCAGGVGDEQDFVEALGWGYAAAQLGTRFLATEECQIPASYKAALVRAGEADIVWTNRLAGTTSSVIRTPQIEAGGLMVGPLLSFLLRQPSTKKLTRTLMLLRSLRTHERTVNGPSAEGIWQAGKGVGKIRAIEPAAAIVRRFQHALDATAKESA
jgi:nitronate monooxygenase